MSEKHLCSDIEKGLKIVQIVAHEKQSQLNRECLEISHTLPSIISQLFHMTQLSAIEYINKTQWTHSEMAQYSEVYDKISRENHTRLGDKINAKIMQF